MCAHTEECLLGLHVVWRVCVQLRDCAGVSVQVCMKYAGLCTHGPHGCVSSCVCRCASVQACGSAGVCTNTWACLTQVSVTLHASAHTSALYVCVQACDQARVCAHIWACFTRVCKCVWLCRTVHTHSHSLMCVPAVWPCRWTHSTHIAMYHTSVGAWLCRGVARVPASPV